MEVIIPAVKNSLSYATMQTAAEFTQQTLKNAQNGNLTELLYDFVPIRQMFYYGVYAGALVYLWMLYLEKLFPGNTFQTILKKVLVDHLACTPIMMLQFFCDFLAVFTCFFLVFSYLQNKPIMQELSTKFPSSYATATCFWPIAQIVNFRFIAKEDRVRFLAVMSFLWANYLAYMK